MVETESMSHVYQHLANELMTHKAEAYVHIGDNRDDTLRYLSAFNGPDRDYAFVFADNEAILCVPDSFEAQAQREFVGDKIIELQRSERTSAVNRAFEVLDMVGNVRQILIPDSTTYAVYHELADSQYKIKTGSNLWPTRSIKTPNERKRIAAIERITESAMARAESILASATISENELIWKCKPLTTDRLRREINAHLARLGVTDANNTVVGSGPSCAELHYNGDDLIRPDRTVLIDIAPQDSGGYYGDMTRTFVPGILQEWEREVYAIVSEALKAGLERIAEGPGIKANSVHRRICDSIESHGYETGDVDVGLYHGTGHGIGTRLHEPPFFSGDRYLNKGNIVTIEPGLYDPSRGGVRLEDLVVITDDGYEKVVDYPLSPTPEVRVDSIMTRC
ncbi:M24 family metallopeptidase [Halocatena marina]|uniref:M24 family metallopeptidase n=1 Tax=Halocatena marina TaxID=2934937 RepID=UPI00200E5328|nr:Xaa-Pro peptidase family protein [Halocatena marina]